VLLIPNRTPAPPRKVVEPKETPTQDGVGVIVGVLVGGGVLVMVGVSVGVGVLVAVGVFVGAGMLIDEDTRHTPSKVNVVSKFP
jgi:UDP-3-O-[3-hydroxymyristoyl] glucosamine N-acyltransferase